MKADAAIHPLVPALALALGLAVSGCADTAASTDAELSPDQAHLAQTTLDNPDVTYHVRFDHRGEIGYGILEGETIRVRSGAYFDGPSDTRRTIPLGEVRLLSPLDPDRVSKVVGVAVNTMRPQLADLPPTAHPRWFAKFPTSIIGPGDGIELPEEAGNLNYEAELVLVIGREARHVSVQDALDYVWGVTAGNDMSENSWYGEGAGREGPTRMISKGTDSWAPIGPAIAVGLDYSDIGIVHRLNGEVTQDGRTTELVQSPAELVSYLSRYVTLLPGDIIFTGTVLFEEGARRAMQVGDEIEVEVEGIGLLRNTIVPMEGTPWEDRPIFVPHSVPR